MASRPTVVHSVPASASSALQDSPPKLAPPGAGVPWVERLVGGLRLALAARRGPAAATAVLRAERAAMVRLMRPLSQEQAGTRVLVPRLRGLEDSSRWWSAWMTLDHVRIVNLQIAQVIAVLGEGRVPPGHASTAAVKPSPHAGAQVREAFEASCDAVERSVEGLKQPRSTVRFAHPWFGPLDTAGWHAMAGMHMGIHRAQLEAIAQRLAAGNAGQP